MADVHTARGEAPARSGAARGKMNHTEGYRAEGRRAESHRTEQGHHSLLRSRTGHHPAAQSDPAADLAEEARDPLGASS
jgi:hypothetical protein